MAIKDSYGKEINQVLFEGNSSVKKVILNRPSKLNCFSADMIAQMRKKLKEFENDSTVKLIILKGNGNSFSAGGDISAMYKLIIEGHWSFGILYYTKDILLNHLIATYQKPVVALLDGIVMGGGVGLSMYAPYKIVTENTIFSMPEARLGYVPDAGASHFLSRLPNYLGEYIGLTGAALDGVKMITCGLATHFVLSKDLHLLENSLEGITSWHPNIISQVISEFSRETNVKEDNNFTNRLKIINKCFSRETVEDILMALEEQAEQGEQTWTADAIKYMKSACPTSLKIFLKSIREGRYRSLEQCYVRDHLILSHSMRKTMGNDFFEWEPSKLELVTKERVDKFFSPVDDDDWEPLKLVRPARSDLLDATLMKPKL